MLDKNSAAIYTILEHDLHKFWIQKTLKEMAFQMRTYISVVSLSLILADYVELEVDAL